MKKFCQKKKKKKKIKRVHLIKQPDVKLVVKLYKIVLVIMVLLD